jgi:hypothetical protein
MRPWARRPVSCLLRHQFVIERSLAWLGHLGSRSLVTFAWVWSVPLLGAVAFATFAVTDGLAGSSEARDVDRLAPGVLGRHFRVA